MSERKYREPTAPETDTPPPEPPLCDLRESCDFRKGHPGPCISYCEHHAGASHFVAMSQGAEIRWCPACDHELLCRLGVRIQQVQNPVAAAQICNPPSLSAFLRATAVRALRAAIDHLTKKEA